MSIKALDGNIVKRLTTTQVITSVFSAVKELVENSLDAGAKNIEVVLKNKGLSVIEVKDNGSGISAESANLMGLQGYTSKLTNFNDLESLTTYGFRGEALSSLCKVSKVQVITRTVEDNVGRCYTMDHNGTVTAVQHCHRTLGTTVRAENLFYNIPVRRQVITDSKTANKDIKTTKKWLQSYGICRPEVSISFIVDSKNLFLKHAKPNYRDCLIEIFGRKLVTSCEFITHQDNKINIVLTVPRKDLSDLHEVCSAENSHIFVNKRPVYFDEFEKAIGKIIGEYFKDKLGKSKLCFFLRIDVSPSEIDVNLEPNKVKILMINQSSVLELIKKLLVEYYGLEEETDEQAGLTNSETISSPAYFDSTFNDSETEEEMSNKKRKLTKKNSRSSLKKSKMNDDDKENVSREFMEPIEDTIKEKDTFKEKEKDFGNESEIIEDVLSQVPVVDLGEDFCTQEIIDKPTLTIEEMELLEKKMQSGILTFDEDNVSSSTPDLINDAPARSDAPSGGTNVVIGRPSPGSQKIKSEAESGFQIFCRTNHSQMSNKSPGMNPVDSAAKLAEKWRQLSPAERQHYRELGRNTHFPLDTSFSNRSQKKKLSKAPEKDNRLMKMLKQQLENRKLAKVEENESKNENENEIENENSTGEKNNIATVVPLNINMDDIKDAQEGKGKVSLEKYRIIGKLNEVCFATTNTQIWGFKLEYLFDDLELDEVQRQIAERDTRKIEKYFNQWIDEKEDLRILHRIYDLRKLDPS
ncbi:Similar to PMS1: PMS1 protein homolog 1 (Homo sapiens) [Cotesia congregata]|uniref:Similar to PMS1: PMS1 protein homolog 1 (Homo sapiens) n=1 Tax=Cotesia congregata TaxID=51543 RepID=A0A8J2H7D7_COTCN|nr:Similar to PMS1: PMS1 protein homolog 1 (Homo sapiens) [Cotesia congregata]